MKMAGGFSSAVDCIKGEIKQEESFLVWADCMGRMYPADKSLVVISDVLLDKLEKIRSNRVSNRFLGKAKKAVILATLLGRFCELAAECPKLHEKGLICDLVFQQPLMLLDELEGIFHFGGWSRSCHIVLFHFCSGGKVVHGVVW
jgi:hypothetical protein